MVSFKAIFDWYCRIGIFLISIFIIGYILSYSVQIIYCQTSASTMFKSPQCMQKPPSETIEFLFTLSAMLLFSTQAAFTVERIVSIRHPRFHESGKFRVIFITALFLLVFFSICLTCFHTSKNFSLDLIYGITTQVLTISTLPLTVVAQRFSRKMYQADVSSYDLSRKHQLFNSYEITRSIVFALSINFVIQVVAVSFQLLSYSEYFGCQEKYKTEFIVQMLWNLNHIIFPWSVIIFHRGQRAKLISKWKAIFPKSHLGPRPLTNFDGKPIVVNPTQNDYFQQMRVAWTTEHKF